MSDSVEVLETAMQASGNVPLRDGRHVKIHKCQLRHLAAVARYVQKVQALAMTDPVLGNAITQHADDLTALIKDPTFVTQLVIHLEEDTYKLVSDFCSLPRDELASLELDEALEVIVRVVGDNLDFFVGRVLPMVVQTLERQASLIETLVARGLKISSEASSS
jgi:hypothetical protein